MRIDKAEIERVKTSQDLVALVESKGVRLTRKGKQWLGFAPSITITNRWVAHPCRFSGMCAILRGSSRAADRRGPPPM